MKWAWDMGGRATQRKEPSNRAASESGPVQSLRGQGVGGRGAWVCRDVDGRTGIFLRDPALWGARTAASLLLVLACDRERRYPAIQCSRQQSYFVRCRVQRPCLAIWGGGA